MKKPTMADVAAQAGCSKATVSAVVNDKGTVSSSTRRLVLNAMDELHYHPRGYAGPSSKSASSAGVIGYVIKEATNPYYAEALAGIQEVAAAAGYLVATSSSEGKIELEQRIVNEFASCNFVGMIVTPILTDESDFSHFFDLKRLNVPVILIESVRGIRAGLVDTNNVKASAEAVKHLMELGHTRIAHFAGPDYSKHSGERVEGVRRACSESRLIFNDNTMIVPTGDSVEDGYRAGLAFFSAHRRDYPSGVTCYNDLVAIGLLKALRELEIRVPEDVSVVGFDDLDVLEQLSIPLTTVHVPKREMGRKAAELLIKQIEHGSNAAVERVYLEAHLVIRNTTQIRFPAALELEGVATSRHPAPLTGWVDGHDGTAVPLNPVNKG